MINELNKLKTGSLAHLALDGLGRAFCESHRLHVASLQQPGSYDVFGNQFYTHAGTYKPHPYSSSVFLVRTLLREKPSLGRALEIGCGSGVVGLSLLKHGLAKHVVMSDVDRRCVQAAQANAGMLRVLKDVQVLQGSVFAPVAGQQFDSIIFNLPLLHLDHDAATHGALDDANGAVAEQFFGQALDFLKPGGQGYFTYSNVSSAAALERFKENATVSLVAAEWVAKSDFWLMIYCFCARA